MPGGGPVDSTRLGDIEKGLFPGRKLTETGRRNHPRGHRHTWVGGKGRRGAVRRRYKRNDIVSIFLAPVQQGLRSQALKSKGFSTLGHTSIRIIRHDETGKSVVVIE